MRRRIRLLSRVAAGAAGLLLVAWCAPRYGATYVAGASMRPVLRPGDLAVYARSGRAPQKGDVILFDEGDGGRVLHRVTVALADGSVRTKGDANGRADPGRVPASRVRGVVVAVLPCGRAVAFVVAAVRWCYNHVPIANTRR